jgi:hypothetical protein
LPDGKPGGEDSAGPTSSPSVTGLHKNLLEEASLVIPPMDLPFPEYFSKADHRDNYKPF